MRTFLIVSSILLSISRCGKPSESSGLSEEKKSPHEKTTSVIDDYIKAGKLLPLAKILASRDYLGSSNPCRAALKKALRDKISLLQTSTRAELIKTLRFEQGEGHTEQEYLNVAKDGYEPEKLLQFAYTYPYAKFAMRAQAEAAAVLLNGGQYELAWTIYEGLWQDFGPEIKSEWDQDAQSYLSVRMLAAQSGHLRDAWTETDKTLRQDMMRLVRYPLSFGKKRLADEKDLTFVLARLQNLPRLDDHATYRDRIVRQDEQCNERKQNLPLGAYLVNPTSKSSPVQLRGGFRKIVESQKVVCILTDSASLHCYTPQNQKYYDISENIIDVEASDNNICRLDKNKRLVCSNTTYTTSGFKEDLVFENVERFTLSAGDYVCAASTEKKVQCGHTRLIRKQVELPESIAKLLTSEKLRDLTVVYQGAGFAIFEDGMVKSWSQGKDDQSLIPEKVAKVLQEKGVKKILGYNTFCALLKDETALCWQNNFLKDGIHFDQGKMAQVYTGEDFICAMTDRKELFCHDGKGELN